MNFNYPISVLQSRVDAGMLARTVRRGNSCVGRPLFSSACIVALKTGLRENMFGQ
jgi:hypothetical protein